MTVLFVTWDGPQVSYLRTLFLPIFARLQQAGIRFHVLQFGWGDPSNIAANRAACEEQGVSYEHVRVLRHPVAGGALLTALWGVFRVMRAVRRSGASVLMPRSTLPALTCLLVARRLKLRVVFDADGLPLDERVDFASQSPSAWSHRLLRDTEAQAVRCADVVLTRSRKAVAILQARAGAGTDTAKFHVVGNGRNPDVFRTVSSEERFRTRSKLGVPLDAPLLVYAGSLGPQYCLAEMLQLFRHVLNRRSDARLLLLTASKDIVERSLEMKGIGAGLVITQHVPPDSVPAYLACADVGIALRRESFSMQGVAPVKLGEYLLCGLPIICSAGIGDDERLPAQVALTLIDTDDDSLRFAANWFLDTALGRAHEAARSSRAVGMERFSIDTTVSGYREALLSVRL